MSRPTVLPTSWASRLSWLSIGLAAGGAGGYVLLQVLDETLAFQRTGQGVFGGTFPRLFLLLLWAAEAVSLPAGFISLILLSIEEIPYQATTGILLRSLAGMSLGLCGTLILWLVVGHVVIGF